MEELLDKLTDNGKIRMADIGNEGRDYTSFLSRYEFYKNYLRENLPELTLEEIILFHNSFHKFRKVVYAFNGFDTAFALMEYEQKQGKL